jgi:3-hydroxyisobutyrate dehydrogenase
MTQAQDIAPTVAVLGAGALGAAMAARLGETGHDVRLWNRTSSRAHAVAADSKGVTAVDDLRAAIGHAAVVITVLRDGPAVADVMKKAIGGLDTDSVWVQASTVGPQSARELAALAHQHGVAFLDAPVSGSTAPAREGRLVWLVAGSDGSLQRARSTLDDLGSEVLHVGGQVEGSSLKLVVNAWMTASTVAMSEALQLCDALGVSHASLVRALQAGPLAMPYAFQKATAMDERAYSPGFAVQLALKDLDLAAAAADPGPLLHAVRERLARTVEAGHGDDDLAAIDYQRTGADR